MADSTLSQLSGLSMRNYTDSSNYVENSSLTDTQLFLKMLTVSMTTQDPTSPTDGSEFMNQMLQYATMETLSNVTSSLGKLEESINSIVDITLNNHLYGVVDSAINLTGRNVTMLIPGSEDGSVKDSTVTGIVDKISIDDKGIWVEINNNKYSYDNLLSVNKSN